MGKYNVRESMQYLLAAMRTQQIRQPGKPLPCRPIKRRFAGLLLCMDIRNMCTHYGCNKRYEDQTLHEVLTTRWLTGPEAKIQCARPHLLFSF